MEKLRWRIYNLIRDDDENDTAGNIFDGTIISLIIINVIMVIIDTFNGLSPWYESFAYAAEVVSVIIFSIEYLMRVWTAVYIYPDKPPAYDRQCSTVPGQPIDFFFWCYLHFDDYCLCPNV